MIHGRVDKDLEDEEAIVVERAADGPAAMALDSKSMS